MCQHYQLRGSLQSTHPDCTIILKREELGGREEYRASMWEVEGWRWKEQEIERWWSWIWQWAREGEERRKRDFSVSKDFPIIVSDTLHTRLTIGRPWQLHKLAERGSLGQAFDQVCVCCVSEWGEMLCIPGHVSVCVSEERLFYSGMKWMSTDKADSERVCYVCVRMLHVPGMCFNASYLQHVVPFILLLFLFLISARGLLFASDTSHQAHIRVIFQRWSVNKLIVKRLISTQFRLWSREVFIILITGAAWRRRHAPLLGTEQLLWRNLEFDALLKMSWTRKRLQDIRLFLSLFTGMILTHFHCIFRMCWCFRNVSSVALGMVLWGPWMCTVLGVSHPQRMNPTHILHYLYRTFLPAP